jgi:hypothetical protein
MNRRGCFSLIAAAFAGRNIVPAALPKPLTSYSNLAGPSFNIEALREVIAEVERMKKGCPLVFMESTAGGRQGFFLQGPYPGKMYPTDDPNVMVRTDWFRPYTPLP